MTVQLPCLVILKNAGTVLAGNNILFIYLLQINSTRIQTNNKITLKLMETMKEKLWRRRQPKALMHHTRDAPLINI